MAQHWSAYSLLDIKSGAINIMSLGQVYGQFREVILITPSYVSYAFSLGTKRLTPWVGEFLFST